MTASSIHSGILASLAGAALTMLCAAPGFAASATPDGDAGRGKETYGRIGCYECHGTEGQGGVGPRIAAPVPLPWADLANFVRTTDGEMPPYTKEVLPDQDLADIYVYLKSIPVHNDPGKTPLLSQ